jgi:adenylate kinase
MKNIIISGTPGCGKTAVSKVISNSINAQIISLNEVASSDNFSFEFDQERETYIVDFKILMPFILKEIKNIKELNPPYLIIEGHFADIIPNDLIDIAIILRCSPDELYERLKDRNYKNNKITENVQAEILGNCVNYFLKKKINYPLFEIDTSNKSVESVVETIIDIIKSNKNSSNYTQKYHVGHIDWLEKLFQENRLNDYFE